MVAAWFHGERDFCPFDSCHLLLDFLRSFQESSRFRRVGYSAVAIRDALDHVAACSLAGANRRLRLHGPECAYSLFAFWRFAAEKGLSFVDYA